MERKELLQVIAALAARSGTGVCHFRQDELDRAPVKALVIDRDKSGDLWLNISNLNVIDTDEE